jgi:uncharacterized membrane protein YhaH (DUF805 family)
MKWFFEALTKYATFSGRSRRKEYWYFTLFYVILAIVFAVFAKLANFDPSVAMRILQLGLFIPSLAVGVRRMHDVDKNGWYVIIPIYNIILACTSGTVGDNQYGPDPKGGILYGAADYEKPFDVNAS